VEVYTIRTIIGIAAWLFFLAMTIYALTQKIWSVALVGGLNRPGFSGVSAT